MLNFKSLKKVYCGLIAIFPIINRYEAPIPMITLAELLLLMFFCLGLMMGIYKYKIVMSLVPWAMYLFLYIIGELLFPRNQAADIIGSTLRLFYLYAMVLLVNRTYVEKEILCDYISNVGIIMAVYSLFQLFFSQFSVYLPANIPFLKVMGVDADARIAINASYNLQYRPSGLFTEPAALCIFLALALTIVLFRGKNNNRRYIYAVLLTMASIFSRSSTGLIIVVLIWGMYICNQKNLSRKQILFGILGISIGGIAIFAILGHYDIIEYFIERIWRGGPVSFDLSKTTRFKFITNMLGATDSTRGLLFGAGIIELTEYLPGFARVFFCLGVIGLSIIVMQMISLHVKSDALGKKVLLIYVILNIGTEALMGVYLMPYLAIVTAGTQTGNE